MDFNHYKPLVKKELFHELEKEPGEAERGLFAYLSAMRKFHLAFLDNQIKWISTTTKRQRWMSKTTHSLCHIALHVRKWGPLWTTSCFTFESFYHYLVQNIHGTRYVLHQKGKMEKAYVEGIGGSLTLGDYPPMRVPDTHLKEMFQHGVYALGRTANHRINAQQRQLIRNTAGLGNGADVRTFTRAFLNQETVMGTSHGRSKKRTNSVDVLRGGQVYADPLLPLGATGPCDVIPIK